MKLNPDGKTVAAMDCLVPGIGEIIGGSQREERLDILLDRIHELGLNEEDYWWYLDLRRFGGARHVLHLRNGQEVRQLGQFHQSFLQNMNAIAIIYFTSWLVKRKMSDGLRTERRHSS